MADSGYALYLQSAERLAESADPAHAAAWAGFDRQILISSGIAGEADAGTEAARALAFFKGPLVEVKEIFGTRIDVHSLKGKCVTINGHLTFVLGGGEDQASGTSYIEGLRKGAA